MILTLVPEFELDVANTMRDVAPLKLDPLIVRTFPERIALVITGLLFDILFEDGQLFILMVGAGLKLLEVLLQLTIVTGFCTGFTIVMLRWAEVIEL